MPIVHRIWKELDVLNGDYEGSLTLIRKETPEFIGEIEAMIDNDLSKLLRFIYREMGVSELPIRPVEDEDIRYFSYRANFCHRTWCIWEKIASQSF